MVSNYIFVNSFKIIILMHNISYMKYICYTIHIKKILRYTRIDIYIII